MRAKLPLEERAALNAADWCSDIQNILDYVGPNALITDAQEFIRRAAGWRECYRPMLRLMGAENKAPRLYARGAETRRR